jgi:hypothetical protein
MNGDKNGTSEHDYNEDEELEEMTGSPTNHIF